MRWLFLSAFLLVSGFTTAQQPQNSAHQNFIEKYSAYYLSNSSGQTTLFTGKIQETISRSLESLYLRERDKIVLNEWGEEAYPEPVPTYDSYGIGNLYYDGVLYKDVSMRLDLCRDELIVRTTNKVQGILLDPEKIAWADFFGYRVIYIPEKSPEFKLPKGYYLEIHSGNNRVLEKESFMFNVSERTFVNRSIKYYIEKNGTFHRVKNKKGSILRVLKEHRRELDNFIRNERLNIKKNMEKSVVLIVSEYERLNNAPGL